jgi:uncharacterized protein (DUF2267 family)
VASCRDEDDGRDDQPGGERDQQRGSHFGVRLGASRVKERCSGAVSCTYAVEQSCCVKFEEFVRKVGERADVLDRYEAEKTAVVVLQALCDRLTGKEADDLLAQLPAIFSELMITSPSPLPISTDEFVARVAAELAISPGDARMRTRAVFATLREAVTRGELEDVLEQLDPEYADLLA